MSAETWKEPLLWRYRDGEALTAAERLLLPLLLFRAWLKRRIYRMRNTPALRERCVEFAVRSGAKGWAVADEAKRLADFIIGRDA